MATNSSPGPTWYDILGVERDATPDVIKAAWRAATDKFEPGSGTSQFRLFNEAADVLLDPERRQAYDAELAGAAPAEPEVVEAQAEVVEAEAEVVEPEPEAVEPDAAEPADPVESAEPQADEPAPEPPPDDRAADEPVDAPEPATAKGPLAGLGRLPDVVIAVIAALAVASLVLAGFLAIRIQHRVDDANAGPEASASAERDLKQVLSYDYRHMEADRDRAAQFLTPTYRKDYLKNFNDLLIAGPDGGPGPAVKTKAVVTADVLDTGIVDAERDRVRVVAFVNQSSVKGDSGPTILQNRLVVTMVHRGDDWLIDKITSY
jgi:Mce-associated membrane protein